MTDQTVGRVPRVDPAGRPLHRRGRQALVALSILVCWICMTLIIFWVTRGDGREIAARFFVWMAIVAWLCAESFGGRRAQIWPASALAVAGSLSLGFGVVLSTVVAADDFFTGLAIISGVASLSMITYLFRFRLPGLVSPIITFAIIALFLFSVGVNRESVAQIEGFSPRGILAALIESPVWMAAFAALAAGAVVLARRLDLYGDDFGLASARPLHIIGAGVLALILGRIFGMLPPSGTIVMVTLLWCAGMAWGLKINRFAVTGAIHLATAKPLVLAIATIIAASPDAVWTPTMDDWLRILVLIVIVDLVVWPRLHRVAMAHDWILGPGGRVPQPRKGWWWRYWPYA